MFKNKKITVVDEPIFKEFCIDKGISESSIKGYKYALQKYSDFTNKTLDELIEEAEYDEEEGIRLRKRKITKYLRDYEVLLEKMDMTDRSRKLNILLVRAFYNRYDIALPKSKGRKTGKQKKPQESNSIADLPNMEEIQRFMEHCNNTYKVIVLLGLSSGMGSAEKSSLTFKHLYDALGLSSYPQTLPELIEKAKSKGNKVLTWNIVRIKTRLPYHTFSSPESLDRIILYLEELNHKNPEYKPSPDDKLLRNTGSNRPIKPNNMCSTFNYINRTKGFRKVKDHYVMKNHALRKYFGTTLVNMKVNILSTKKLMGHKLNAVDNAYFKTDVESLKKDYLEVLDALTTDKVQIKVIDKSEEIKEEVNILKKLVISSGNLPPEYRDMILKEELKAQVDFERRYANDKAFRDDLLEKDREEKLKILKNDDYTNAV